MTVDEGSSNDVGGQKTARTGWSALWFVLRHEK